jgi:hypothetical protein
MWVFSFSLRIEYVAEYVIQVVIIISVQTLYAIRIWKREYPSNLVFSELM